MQALSLLLDAAAKRRQQHQASYVAFMAAHDVRDIGELSREESRDLFAILLMQAGLDAEMRVLRKLIRRLSP
jgi:hypothetical protein